MNFLPAPSASTRRRFHSSHALDASAQPSLNPSSNPLALPNLNSSAFPSSDPFLERHSDSTPNAPVASPSNPAEYQYLFTLERLTLNATFSHGPPIPRSDPKAAVPRTSPQPLRRNPTTIPLLPRPRSFRLALLQTVSSNTFQIASLITIGRQLITCCTEALSQRNLWGLAF